MSAWTTFVEFCGGIGGLAAFLDWLGVTPQHVRSLFSSKASGKFAMPEIPVAGKRWKLALSLLLFALSIGLSTYSLYAAKYQQSRGPQTGFEITHWENFIPADHRYGSGVRVTIATERTMRGPIQLFIVFDGDIEQYPIAGRFTNGGPFPFESQELLKSHADIFNVKWRTPEWIPTEPVEMELLSRYPRQPKWVIPVNYNPNP